MADTRLYVAAAPKTLSASLTTTATTVALSDVNSRDGTALTMADFGTLGHAVIEPGGNNMELISFTGITSTSLTGVTRGLKFEADYSQDTSLRKTHAAGVKVVFSNTPGFYNEFTAKGNDETITGTWTFTSTAIPIFDSDPTLTDDKHVATKKYADDLAIAGAPDAAEAVKGLNEMATTAESIAGTDTGTTTGPLVVKPSDIAANVQNAAHSYAADAEASDAYVITLSPAPSAYATGQVFYFKANTANTTGATLNVNSLGAKNILKNHDQTLETNDIEAGQIVHVVYDGTQFQMQSPQATMASSANLAEMGTFFGATDITGAEAETLTDGSEATTAHYHDTILQLEQNFLDNKWRELWYRGKADVAATWVEVQNGGGGVTPGQFSSVILAPANGDDGILWSGSTIYFTKAGAEGEWDNEPDVEFIICCALSSSTNNRIALGFHEEHIALAEVPTESTVICGVYFAVNTSGELYSVTTDGTTNTNNQITGITLSDYNVYRMTLKRADGNAKFYVNGVLKQTHTTNLPAQNNELPYPFIGMTGTGANTAKLVLLQPALWRLAFDS